MREKWSEERLASTAEQRSQIIECLKRLKIRENRALDNALLWQGGCVVARPFHPHLRAWFHLRWEYLIAEYEKVLPHVEELHLPRR